MENIVQIISIFFVLIFVLFLPGFTLSYVFFSRGKIDSIERIALSFALSISTVPLLTFYTNLIGIPINKESVVAETLLIIFSAALVYLIKKKKYESGV